MRKVLLAGKAEKNEESHHGPAAGSVSTPNPNNRENFWLARTTPVGPVHEALYGLMK
jgi:hypothetical protein